MAAPDRMLVVDRTGESIILLCVADEGGDVIKSDGVEEAIKNGGSLSGETNCCLVREGRHGQGL